MFYVYVIHSNNIDKYYVGYTSSLENRLISHNTRSAKSKAFTKRASDWAIVFNRSFETKQEALDFEKYIKKQKSRKFIEELVESFNKTTI